MSERESDNIILFNSCNLLVLTKFRKLILPCHEEIEEIACKHGSPDIFMRFKVTPDELAQKSKSLFGGSHADLEFRRYVCNNEQERDSILQV